jgi:outer membrane murein-binding lipoprotein Lpp
MSTTTQATLLLLSALLAGCATASGPSPLWLDAQTLCQQQGQASASSPELRSDAYADQCMISRGLNPRWK